jgi:hypothetical protein
VLVVRQRSRRGREEQRSGLARTRRTERSSARTPTRRDTIKVETFIHNHIITPKESKRIR